MNTNLQITGNEFSVSRLKTYLCQFSNVTIGQATGNDAKTILPVTVPFDCVCHTKYVADKYNCAVRWVRGKVV